MSIFPIDGNVKPSPPKAGVSEKKNGFQFNKKGKLTSREEKEIRTTSINIFDCFKDKEEETTAKEAMEKEAAAREAKKEEILEKSRGKKEKAAARKARLERLEERKMRITTSAGVSLKR